MDKVRFGVIGYGNMGSGHAGGLFDGKVKDGILGAVCDINPKRIELAKERFGEKVRYFDDAETMIKSGEIDAVIIAVPHYDHPKYAVMAFDNDIHVMCEKPAGVFTKQVREMNEAAAKARVVFAMMFNQRTNCLYKKMREMVQNGELGELRRSNWIITDWYRPQAYYDSGDWRATWKGEGGGVLLNQCPHNLDLWQWICGMPQKMTAFAAEGKWHDIEVEDDVLAFAEYENGATGVFITTTADYPGTNRFEVSGELGKLVCENNKLLFYKNKMSEREFNKNNSRPFGKPGHDVIEIETDGKNPQHNGVLEAFVANILRGELLVAKGEEGINGLMISNSMHLSSWLGKTVELPVDEEMFLSELNKKIGDNNGR